LSDLQDKKRINLVKHQIWFYDICEEILIQTKYPDCMKILFHVWVADYEGKPFDLSSLAAVVGLPHETVRRRVKSLEKDDLVQIKSENQKRHTVVVTSRFLERTRPIIDKGLENISIK